MKLVSHFDEVCEDLYSIKAYVIEQKVNKLQLSLTGVRLTDKILSIEL